jgi:ribosomal protein S18 acetylase RimI-like enzyme
MEIRPYRPGDPADWAGVYDVCVRTAASGGDARGRYSSDDLMPDIFAGPYLALEPELAFVLDDGERVVGYVLGAADTVAWAAAHRARWLPTVAAKYRSTAPRTPEDDLVDLLHHPEENVHPELADHPAHLHIDILPGYQGAGWGRALIRVFLAALRERGVPAVHLGVSPTNTAALAFYARIGLRELPVGGPDVIYLGAPTDLPV